MPLVSVIIPNYNHARYLPARLSSVFEQTFRDFEVIALDDCSTDESRTVLADAAHAFPGVQLVFNERNSGSTFKQWRKGLDLAKGKYVWIAESDDFADRHLLETLVAKLEENPHVGVAYCQSHIVDENGAVTGSCGDWARDLHPSRWDTDYVNSGREEVVSFLIVHSTIPNASAVLVRRELLERALRGAEVRRLTGDWLTWCQALLESDVAFVAKSLNYFRCHRKSVRDTVRASIACAEGLSLKAALISQLTVAPQIRRRAFQEEFQKWRVCVRHPEFRWDFRSLAAVLSDATKVWWPAPFMMAACLFKNRLCFTRKDSSVEQVASNCRSPSSAAAQSLSR